MKNLLSKKGLTLLVTVLLLGFSGMAQQRASPKKKVSQKIADNEVTIQYSSPSVKGRQIWGGLVPYDKVWRTGANEATTIKVSTDCKIEGNDLKAGKYALFTIPSEGEWTVILSSDSKQWGAYKYDASKDALRFKVKPETNVKTESMDISLTPEGITTIAWDELKVSFSIQ